MSRIDQTERTNQKINPRRYLFDILFLEPLVRLFLTFTLCLSVVFKVDYKEWLQIDLNEWVNA